jgi:tetratricopeptide (TPR) repeat protein
MITTQILVKNNEKTIEKTLDSIGNLKTKIIIGNLGCKDRTIEICSRYNLEIIDINEKNMALARNNLTKPGYNFFIHPWEVLKQGEEYLNNIKESSNIYVFENNLISKQQRIWNDKEKFKNPVFETLINKNAITNPEIILYSEDVPNDTKEKLQKIYDWKESRPLDIEPYYYMACCYLSLGDYKNFKLYSNEYFVRENKINSSYIMLKYYNSQVNLFLEEIKESVQNVLFCLSYYPAFAEFWCLLGDIYLKQREFIKAKSFYQNALIIGKKRTNDTMSIEIEKYKEYPEDMIGKIDELIQKTIDFNR